MEEKILQFIIEIPLLYWILIGVLFVLLYVQMHFYFRYYNKVIRYQRKLNKNQIDFTTTRPPVSVVICAQNESDNLEKYLPVVLQQDYPVYEVIVVNDGSTDDSNDLLEKLCKQYPHLQVTFLPLDAKCVSRKKMCLNVAFKKAKYDYLLMIDADCEPKSMKWIDQMVGNYVNGTDVVLGYSQSDVPNSLLGNLIRYDNVTSAMRYFGFALRGRAYRGTSKNLSYRKTLYFTKGFTSQLTLEGGDDNLFIQDVATRRNVRVDFSPFARTISHRKETSKSYFYQKRILLKTLERYKGDIRASIFLENSTRILFYLSFLSIFSFMIWQQQWILAGIALLFFVFRAITQTIIIRKTERILGEKTQFFLIPIFDFIIPLISSMMYLSNGMRQK